MNEIDVKYRVVKKRERSSRTADGFATVFEVQERKLWCGDFKFFHIATFDDRFCAIAYVDSLTKVYNNSEEVIYQV